MIRLTKSRNGEPIFVGPELIVSIEVVDDVTMLNVRSDRIFVTESPAEVARKVLEWKLAMEDYLQGTAMVRNLAKEKLFELAGLEEQKDAPETSD